MPFPSCRRKLGSVPPSPTLRSSGGGVTAANGQQAPPPPRPPPSTWRDPQKLLSLRSQDPGPLALPPSRPAPPPRCFAYTDETGWGGRPRVVPPVGPLGPGRRSRCLLSRSLFLCAAFRGIKADTVVTRSPAGQRSDFTIPITMISNDVYLEGSDGRELYKRAPHPLPSLLGGPWVRGAPGLGPSGERRCPGHRRCGRGEARGARRCPPGSLHAAPGGPEATPGLRE